MSELAVKPVKRESSFDERFRTAFQIASELFALKPDWVTFFREVLGVSGVIRRLFPTPEELSQFEESNEYSEIQEMIKELRDKGADIKTEQEITRVITVRLPQSLHQALREEAKSRRTSINQLCIGKLLAAMDDMSVDQGKKLLP